LVQLLVRGDTSLRREVLSMLSEIGDDEAVKPVAAFLFNPDLWEEARAALERIPGAKSLAALKSGLATAPEDHKPALAHSLRVRGVKVDRYPSEKLTPKRKTDAKTLSAR
jgi:HEAT repeat protein